jgi:alpha-glucosidase
VAAARQEAGSMLELTQALLRLRRERPALAAGGYRTLAVEGDVLVYAREHEGSRYVVALNLEPRPKAVVFGESAVQGLVALSTHLDRAGEPVRGEVALRADEGVVIEVTHAATAADRPGAPSR